MRRLPPEFSSPEDYALWLEDYCIGQLTVLKAQDGQPSHLNKESYFIELKRLRGLYLDGDGNTPGAPV